MNRTERIVLIDDSELDNEFFEWTIRRVGFEGELLIHESGPDALAAIAGIDMARRTVIFLDINMPGMDGFEVASALSSLLPQAAPVALVMLTSSAAIEDIRRARAIPLVRAYCIKPLTKLALPKLLEAVDWDSVPVTVDEGRCWP